jgi:periplasmic divalent cation tolerance protein
MTKAICIQTTVETIIQAETLSQYLLESRLASCIQRVGPIHSQYWWDNQIQDATEFLLLIKTRAENESKLLEEINAKHPYKVPEIIVCPISNMHPSYAKWLVEN